MERKDATLPAQSQPPQEFQLQEPVHRLRVVELLDKLRRRLEREQGGAAMNGGNGRHNGQNGNHQPSSDDELQRVIDEATSTAIQRVKDRDPLGDDKPGIMPKLLIGRQRAYQLSPDRSLLPEDDPERRAYERGEPVPLTESKRYIAAHRLLENLDSVDGFNSPDD